MTVIGVDVVAWDRAFAWCDTETFSGSGGGSPNGHSVKMAINPLGVFVALGTGRVGPFRDAADALNTVLTFDEAVDVLPGAMRRATRVYASMELAASNPLRSQIIALVGFSHRYGGMVAAIFDLINDFEPVLPCRQLLSPAIDHAHVVDDVHSAISVASEQLLLLQREIVDASGGALIVAEVTPGGVRCGPVFDFTTGRMPDAPTWAARFVRKDGRGARP